MYLFVDVTEDNSFTLKLLDQEGIEVQSMTKKTTNHISDELLGGIDELLENTPEIATALGVPRNDKLKTLKGIIAVEGPGRFSTMRTTFTTLNTICWHLKIPLITQGKNKPLSFSASGRIRMTNGYNLALPVYGAPPTITLPKPQKR